MQEHHYPTGSAGNSSSAPQQEKSTSFVHQVRGHLQSSSSAAVFPPFRTRGSANVAKPSHSLNLINQSKMSSPAPLLRPPIPGSRQNGGARTPRLGLAIPPSPSAKPLNSGPHPGGLTLQMPGQMPSRPALPRLQLATPMGSNQTPYEHASSLQNGRPSLVMTTNQSASGGSESSAAHSRSGSFGPLDGRVSGPTSAGSQYSALSFASQYGLRQPQGTPDPASAVGSLYSERSDGGVGMERDGSMNGLEGFDKLSLERGRTLDVEDLDDEGWRIASMEKRIDELSSLGEGAGGAVTKCVLKGGKTIFALKVSSHASAVGPCANRHVDHHNKS